MKRLVWLLLLVFGTALAQVQPVDVRLNPGEVCSCCDRPGACDMPDCVPAPVSAQPAFQAPGSTAVARVSARKAKPAPVSVREKFFVKFVPRVRIDLAQPAMWKVAPAASVPLFQDHCSLLI